LDDHSEYYAFIKVIIEYGVDRNPLVFVALDNSFHVPDLHPRRDISLGCYEKREEVRRKRV